jgi:ABC-type lipoprotein release transport system permease subunit
VIILSYLSQNPIQINTIKLRFSLDIFSLIAADLIVLICVFVASIYPSYKAASIEPVEAMRYE